MSNQRTEQDYDSATPALQQQMNLARRACWRNKIPPRNPQLTNPDPIANRVQAEQPPSDETKTQNTRATCTSSRLRRSGFCSKRMLLLGFVFLVLGLTQGRPNTSAVSVARGKNSAAAAAATDAVTQLNVSTLKL